MPIRIKKPELGPYDRRFRKWAVISGAASLLFALGVGSVLTVAGNNNDKPIATVLTVFYTIFVLCCIITLKCAVEAYRREDVLSALGMAVLYSADLVVCLLNLRFVAVMLVSVYGSQEMVSRLVGSSTMAMYIRSQYLNWGILVIALVITLIMGIAGAVKLIKHTEKKEED
ncbi:MAG: hypothetical protein IJ806_09950 [Ruminococcus sp.]|nr:hypothetical protein [Ruminococcus sp.]